MPAEVWRTRPARSIRRWEAICASFGVCLSVGMKPRERRIASTTHEEVAADPTRHGEVPPDGEGTKWTPEFLCVAQEIRAINSPSTVEKRTKRRDSTACIG